MFSLAGLLTIQFGFGGAAIAAATAPRLAQLDEGFDPEARYMTACFACHSTGAAGAPRVGPGNAGEWTSRLEQGIDAMVENSIAGIGVMPPKGLCFDCAPEELRAIIEFMIESSE